MVVMKMLTRKCFTPSNSSNPPTSQKPKKEVQLLAQMCQGGNEGLDQRQVPAPGQTISKSADVRILSWKSASRHCLRHFDLEAGDDVMGTVVLVGKGQARLGEGPPRAALLSPPGGSWECSKIFLTCFCYLNFLQ